VVGKCPAVTLRGLNPGSKKKTRKKAEIHKRRRWTFDWQKGEPKRTAGQRKENLQLDVRVSGRSQKPGQRELKRTPSKSYLVLFWGKENRTNL